jgi:hypothetical protein
MKQILLSLLILTTTLTFSQSKLYGVVKDSIGKPLEMANVIAMNAEDNSLEGYSITDAKGHYKIKISKPGTYQVKVSYLGFDAQTKILVISESETIKNFTMYESKDNLNAVEITYEMPVTIKGDTIIYNADSFTTGKERKLGDVLKKLPGIEVNDDGEIEVEGKSVSKVMVEGKDFFDGDTKLATKNIPADAIEKIEVLKNYNEVSQMRGLGDDSDNVALNIKLKDGKKNFWFGEVTVGAGEGDGARYLAHPKLFYYSPEKSVNIITDVNNIGEIPFTFQDYFKFSGGFKNLMRSGGGLNISSSSLGFSFLKNNKAQDITNKFAAVNFSQAINKHLDFSGFAIFSDSDTKMQTNTLVTNTFRRTVLDTNGNEVIEEVELDETVDNKTNQANTLGLLKLSAMYKPSSRFQFDYDVILKKSNIEEANNTFRVSENQIPNGLPIEDTIISHKDESPFSVNQNANFYYTLNDKNIFSFGGQFLYEKSSPLYNSLTTQQPFFPLLPTTDENSDFDLSQDKTITTRKLDAVLDYYYILNKKSNLNFTFGSTINHQTLVSNIFQTLDNGSVSDFNASQLTNDVNFNYSDIFLGLHYKLQTGIFTLTPGFTLHQYTSKNEQLGTETKHTPFKLLPDFTAKIALKRSESIRLNYRITTNFTDINKLVEGALYNSYNSISIGNRNLRNALYHNYSLNYFNFNTFSFTNIHGTISYNKKYDIIKNTSSIGVNRINSLVNIDGPEDTFSVRASISKRFGKLKAAISGNTSISNNIRLNTQNNDIIRTKTKSTTQNYKLSLETNFSEWPNFEIGFSSNKNKFDNVSSTTNKPYANVEIGFLKDFIFTADYTYNQFTDDANNIDNTYDFLNANLYYQKKDSKWEFKISTINVLDTKSINEDFYSVFYRSTSEYIVQPRYLMFTIKYDL